MNNAAIGGASIGITMSFHIALALFGVGIPLMVSLAELIGILKKDGDYTAMAQRWTFAMSTLFVAGAISGTMVGVSFAVLLSPFMTFVGKTVILPFSLETYAFFLEAIFLGIYAYTWGKFKNKWTHWLTSLPVIIGSAASAFFITTVSAFMSTPQGFTDKNGVISNVNQLKAMLNPAVPTRTGHSILAYYATTAFVFAAVAAWQFLRRKKLSTNAQRYFRKVLAFSLLLGFIFACAVVVTGDSSARFSANYEPEKFAAAEGVMQTQGNVPLVIGGVFKDNKLEGGIPLPGILSFLVGGSRQTVVRGLNAFNPATWPPLEIHYFFDIMAIIGGLMALVPILFFLSWHHHHRRGLKHSLMGLIILTGILSVVAVEVGWMLTEIGRQPQTINGFMSTQAAFTTSPTILAYAIAFPIFYVILSAVTIFVLVHHYHNRYD